MNPPPLAARDALDDILEEFARVRDPAQVTEMGRRLLNARYVTAKTLLDEAPSPTPSPPVRPAPGGATEAFPPRVEFDALTAQCITNALAMHGCLHVTGLLQPEVVAELVMSMDRVFESYDDVMTSGQWGRGDEWCHIFIPSKNRVHLVRPWLRGSGGVFTADSPRVSARWFGLLRELGVIDILTDFMGEEPITSLDKSTLRRVSSGEGIEWHQDGAFLGLDSGALNVWVTLTDTDTAPGLDIVARSFDEVVETGTGGATYDWSVGPEVMEALVAESPVVNPRFTAGDALIFDPRLMHRTQQFPPDLPDVRYAIETWFFPPSRFPRQQEVPLAL